jgi:CheY-like chemotaxis protein
VLILLDLHLPGVRGIPLMAKFAEKWPGVPIVVMTGLDQPGLQEEMIAGGANAYLCKPVEKGQLISILARLPAS